MENKIFVGDCLDVLQSEELKRYENKVNLIYIDPPYNNGSKFSYKNKQSSQDWSDYLKQRIKCAYKFLKNTGAIFVSMDDKELATLKIILDDIFGVDNFVGTFITKQAQRSNAKHINTVHEYVLCYAKNKKELPDFKINRMDIPEDRNMINDIYNHITNEFNNNGREFANTLLQELIKKYCLLNNITWLRNYNNVDDNGKIYFAKDLSTPGEPRFVNIPSINLHLNPLPTRGWASDKKFIELFNNNRLVFKGDRPYVKHFLEESQDCCPSILNFYSRQGSNALKKLGISNLFDTPKPVELIKFLIRLYCGKDDYIMDFFAGSGTTAQAVYETNIEDKANRNYILIQLNENVNKNTAVYNECVKREITPQLQYILKYRIDTFLKSINKDVDYNFYDV